jgi:hypothetical protein
MTLVLLPPQKFRTATVTESLEYGRWRSDSQWEEIHSEFYIKLDIII